MCLKLNNHSSCQYSQSNDMLRDGPHFKMRILSNLVWHPYDRTIEVNLLQMYTQNEGYAVEVLSLSFGSYLRKCSSCSAMKDEYFSLETISPLWFQAVSRSRTDFNIQFTPVGNFLFLFYIIMIFHKNFSHFVIKFEIYLFFFQMRLLLMEYVYIYRIWGLNRSWLV